MKTRKILTLAIAGVLSALALWLSFRNIDWLAAREAFARANYAWALAAVVNSLFAVYALGWRWRILLSPVTRPRMRTLFRLNILAQCANILIPARANEVVRAWLTGAETGVGAGFAMGTIVIERIFDVAVFAACLVAGPVLFGLGHGVFPAGVAISMGAGAVAFLAFLTARPAVFLRGVVCACRLLPGRLRERVHCFFENAISAFAGLRNPKALTAVALHSVALLAYQVVSIRFLFQAFHLDLPLGAGLFVIMVRQIANVAPAAPGRIGIFEYTVIVALAAYGVARSPALSFALVLHVIAQVPKLVLGLFFLGGKGLRGISTMGLGPGGGSTEKSSRA
jgi:glycosyltransferase 2 family protein